MHKILFSLACLLFTSTVAVAGNFTGNVKFEKNDFAGAIEAYSKTISKSSDSTGTNKKVAYAKYRIGESYSHLNEPKQAVEYIGDAITSGYEEPAAYLVYGKNLQKMGKYKRAKAAFEEYGRLRPTDSLVKNLISSCDFALRHAVKNPISPAKRLDGVNTEEMEYGIGFYKNGIIYASTKSTKKGIQSRMYFTDRNSEFTTSKPVDNMVKSKRGQNTGTFAIDTTYNVLYYTRCLSNEDNDCFIYSSKYDNEKWKNKGVVRIGDRRTDTAHPALSENGNRLYFSSTCEGGYGGSDIWYVTKKANGSWESKATNAGAVVNTAGNETFPYVVGNTLIFASDGQVGFGGYDLYSTQIDGLAIAKIQNLMRPINSSADDINLIVSEENDEAFLVSSRKGETNDDIYHFKGIFTSMMVSGHVYDKKTEKPISNSQIIINGMGKSQTVQTNDEGYYYAFIEAGDFYKLMASSLGFLSDMAMIKTEKTTIGSFPVTQDFYLSQASLSISGRVYDLETDEPFINEEVMLLEKDSVIQRTRTSITGRYTFTDLQNGKEYQVKVNKPNFLSISSKPFVYSEESGANSSLDLASIPCNQNANDNGANYAGSTIPQGREILLYDIYYNFDSANLRSDSKQALHRIVMLLKSNPKVKLEFGSHTDTRGTKAYNLKLSDARAKSVVDYLVEFGINRTRLSWKGYGQNFPLIPNAVTEAEHKLNRRTTFKIID